MRFSMRLVKKKTMKTSIPDVASMMASGIDKVCDASKATMNVCSGIKDSVVGLCTVTAPLVAMALTLAVTHVVQPLRPAAVAPFQNKLVHAMKNRMTKIAGDADEDVAPIPHFIRKGQIQQREAAAPQTTSFVQSWVRTRKPVRNLNKAPPAAPDTTAFTQRLLPRAEDTADIVAAVPSKEEMPSKSSEDESKEEDNKEKTTLPAPTSAIYDFVERAGGAVKSMVVRKDGQQLLLDEIARSSKTIAQ